MPLQHILPPGVFEVIDRAGIATTKELITLSVWDIKKYTNLSVDDILFVKNIVADKICPKIISCDILKREGTYLHSHVPTGCNAIDELLKGGIRKGTICEIFGESGCGKTQFALQLALNNWAHGCLYICTEDAFPAKRFEEIKRAQPTYDHSIDYGQKVFIEHITEASDLLTSISVRLPKLLTQNNLAIVIIDSIAAPFRCESTNYVKRAEDLREIAVCLTTIAQKHNIAILCINQVTASFEDSANVLPSLGLAWSNMVTTRLMIEKTIRQADSKYQKHTSSCYIRELSTVFSPDLPNDRIEFIITSRGIEAL